MIPHDALFKAVFSEAENAVILFRQFLPPALVEALDLARAEHIVGSFVDDALKDQHTDVLYKIPWRDPLADLASKPESELEAEPEAEPEPQPEAEAEAEPEDDFIYVLFEHQSTVNLLMPYRMHRYSVKIWDQWFKDHDDARYLPPLFPLVLYHGERPWKASTELSKLFDGPHLVAEIRTAFHLHLPQLQILLWDLADLPDDDLPGSGVVRITLFLFKHGRKANILKLLTARLDDFHLEVARGSPGLQNITRVINYISEVNEHVSDEAIEAFVAPLGDEAREITMTLAERHRQEGLQKGLQKGLQEKQKSLQAVAQKLIDQGMSVAQVAEITELPLEDVQALLH
ncbi:MAG: Rpn family recombination-promoting nuclease/putative transposase [Deltaproteobacteria bacterium]|nr:Rpn family recombination-promoting nuclease/putative transposase [Deltaproteobacteria bacterium]